MVHLICLFPNVQERFHISVESSLKKKIIHKEFPIFTIRMNYNDFFPPTKTIKINTR